MQRASTLGRRLALAGFGALAAPRSAPGQSAPAPAAKPPERVSVTLAGNRVLHGRLHLPAKVPAPAILLVHDGFGATDDLDRLAGSLASDGFAAVVVDLLGGRTADTDEAAAELARTIDPAMAVDGVTLWFDWARSRNFCDRRLGSVGFGHGAEFAMLASDGASVTATAIFYGRVDAPAERLHRVDGRIIGHFGDRDGWATTSMRIDLEIRLKRVQRDFKFFRYPSAGPFVNPRSRHFEKTFADLAWIRTVASFKEAYGLP